MAPNEPHREAEKDSRRERLAQRSQDHDSGTNSSPRHPPAGSAGSPTAAAAQPRVDFGDMPDLSGRREGDAWSVTRPDGQVVNYRIPEGNGNKSVDISVVGADGGLLGSMRAAMNEPGGGFQQWIDVDDGPSIYVGQDTRYSNPYAGIYNQGTSTAGAPDSAKAYLPDFGQEFPLLENGEVVGQLGIVPSPNGHPDVYDNIYRDKFGNLSRWQNRSTEFGGMVGWQEGQLNQDGTGWQVLPTGTSGSPERWAISPGSPLMNRTEDSSVGTHVQTLDPSTGAYSDRFTSKVSPEKGYFTYRDARGTTTRIGEDGSLIVVDGKGEILAHRPAPERVYSDDRNNWEKAWDYAGNSVAAFVEGTKSLLGQNSNTYGDPALSPEEAEDQNQKEALAGMAGMSLALSAGLALMAIDGYEGTFGGGLNDDAAYTPTDNVLGTLNTLSQLSIGVDWENLDEHPGQTLSDAIFGASLFFLPKAPRAMGLDKPPHLPPGVRNGFGDFGTGLGTHPLPALAEGYPGRSRPWANSGGFEMRNSGDGVRTAPGRPSRDRTDDGSDAPADTTPANPTRTPGNPSPPPLPGGILEPHYPQLNGAGATPENPHDSEIGASDTGTGRGIPWEGKTELTPPGHWPVGVYPGPNSGQWYRPRPGGGLPTKVPMADWARYPKISMHPQSRELRRDTREADFRSETVRNSMSVASSTRSMPCRMQRRSHVTRFRSNSPIELSE